MQDPFGAVVGQEQAVTALRAAARQPTHAYLFVGPAGSGKHDAARAFAATVLDDERALHDTHPDVITVEREGASINVAQAREISRLAARTPNEGGRKVLVLTEFHLVEEAAPALLKTIEEASATTIFVILADVMTKELVTIASRCVRIEFHSLSAEVIEAKLLEEGCHSERAREASRSAFGNLTRARILANDDAVVARRDLWASTFMRLDGTGAGAATLIEEIVSAIDHACEPLAQMQAKEVEDLRAQSKETGIPVTATKTIEASQKRQIRRLRTDELRAGFSILSDDLGRRFREASDRRQTAAVQTKLEAVNWANDALQFNPGEQLLLQGLFVKLSR